MERDSPDGVNDSGDDRTTEASSSARPLTARRPPRARVPRDANAYYDEVEDFKAVLRAIERETTEDLRAPIAVRGHLERLMEEYWSIRVAQQVQQQQSNADDDADDTASDAAAAAAKAESLRLRILHHPNIGVAPSMMRWPLDTLAVPRPRWSLADEITTVVDRTKRLRKRSASVRDDEEDDGEEELDETPPSLTLPVITQCQAALVRLLHDVAHRDIAVGGHNKRPRRDIVTWRDVLKTIALQRHTPSAVLKATQERLEGIYGPTRDESPSSATAAFVRRFSADPAIPPPAMLAGFTASARDGLTAFLLAPSDPIPAEKSELHTDVVPGSTRKRHYEARRALNEQLLFDGRPTFVPSKPQVLAPPPVDDDDDDDDPDDDDSDDDEDDDSDDDDDDSDDDDDIPEDTPHPPPAKRAR